jgi:Protein of unknown function (DUF4012)
LLLLVAWGAWVAWTALSVRSDASSMRDELRDLRADLDVEAFLDGDGVDDLTEYGERFAGIGNRLENPLLAPLRVLPFAGRQLSAASHQAEAAATALESAAELGDELRIVVDRGVVSGPQRVETLREVASLVRGGRTTFEELDLGPDQALVASLASAREEIEEARLEVLDGLDRTASMSVGLADFFEGPSDYLLFAANNAQMQNGQGMFLSAGVLHVEDGRLDLGSMESLAEVPAVVPPVPLDADLAARWGWLDPNHDIRHLGLSHRFPITAQTATSLWTALGHPAVDGVLVVDPHMVEAIMEATGPVQTSQGERDNEDVLEFILHDQYQVYLEGGPDSSYTEERRDELDEIARTVLEELEQVDELEPELLERFRAAASGRHLLMWSADPTVQEGFEAAGVDGQISPDSLLLSLVNRSGNKLDWFTRMSADLSVERKGDVYEAVLDVTITNKAPASGEPSRVVGPYPGSGLERGEYLGLVTLNLPAAAVNNRFDGVDPLAVAGADGANRTVAAWVRVPRGTTTHLVARFELPAAMAELVIEPSARTFPTEWSYDGKEWKDRERRTVAL